MILYFKDMKVMDKLKLTWQSDEQQSIAHIVHEIKMGDVEDPDLFVAEPIYKWQQTPAGKWVMENTNPSPMWNRHIDQMTYGYRYTIRAYFTPKQLTYYKLKFE
jgi:hypothetical protein